MNTDFFVGNRNKIGELLEGKLVVLTAYAKMQLLGDSAAPFMQEVNFWYLSGVEQADWRLVIDGRAGRSWLIAPEVDEVHQLFDGTLSHDDAKEISGVDEVLDQKAGEALLQDLAKKHTVVYTLGRPSYADHADFTLNPAPDRLHKELKGHFASVKDCQKELAKLRAIKQPAEVDVMSRAATLTAEAFEVAKAKIPSCQYEYEAEAELTYHFRRHNAAHAFEPIVASGKNACTLHYVANSGTLQSGEMLLIDAGARFGAYSSDVTRTFSASEPTKRQAEVHQAVRRAEQQIIALIQPGLLIKKYLESVDAIMKDVLLSLCLMKDKSDEASFRRYFPHAVSHGLGIEVHESLGGYKELRSGMALTVEPGVYIPEEGIGVRIEDTVLVTDTGHQNLTEHLSTNY